MSTLTPFLAHLQIILGIAFTATFLSISILLCLLLCVLQFTPAIKHADTQASYRLWNRCFSISLLLTFAMTEPILLQLSALWPTIWNYSEGNVGLLLFIGTLLGMLTQLGFLRASLYEKYTLSSLKHRISSVLACISFLILIYLALLSSYWLIRPNIANFSSFFQEEIIIISLLIIASGSLPVGLIMLSANAWHARLAPLHQGNQLIQKIATSLTWFGVVLFTLFSLFIPYRLPEFWIWSIAQHGWISSLFFIGLICSLILITIISIYYQAIQERTVPINLITPYATVLALLTPACLFALLSDYVLTNNWAIGIYFEGIQLNNVLISLILFIIIYIVLMFAFISIIYQSAHKPLIERIHHKEDQ